MWDVPLLAALHGTFTIDGHTVFACQIERGPDSVIYNTIQSKAQTRDTGSWNIMPAKTEALEYSNRCQEDEGERQRCPLWLNERFSASRLPEP
jgi:hypothetical protein